jgi:hypothetical protein
MSFKTYLENKLVIENKAMATWMTISEASYAGNIGFEEMVKFYQKAKPQDEKQMEYVLEKNDWEGFKALIKRVLGVTLK